MKNFILSLLLFISSAASAAPAGSVVLLSPGQATDFMGAVFYVASSTCPTGSIAADGSAISRTTNALLFSKLGTTHGVGDGSTTFNVPDLRGIFIRGAGTSAAIGGVTYSGTLGTKQADQMQGHVHNPASNTVSFTTNGGAIVNLTNSGPVTGYNSSISSPVTDGTNGTPRTGAETRPANIGLTACISTSSAQVPMFFGPNYQTTAAKITTYQIATADEIVQGDTTSGGFTVTLPSAVAVGVGKMVSVSKINSGAGLLTISGNIEGAAATTVLHRKGETDIFWSDGATWQWRSDKYRTESSNITGSATTPTISIQSGNWLGTSITRNAIGDYSGTIVSTIFSATPVCSCTNISGGGACSFNGNPGTTGYRTLNRTSAGATADHDVSLVCTGPR